MGGMQVWNVYHVGQSNRSFEFRLKQQFRDVIKQENSKSSIGQLLEFEILFILFNARTVTDYSVFWTGISQTLSNFPYNFSNSIYEVSYL